MEWSGESTSSYGAPTSYSYSFYYYPFYLMVIMATLIDDDFDSFVNINNFDLDNKGADV